VIFFDFLFSNSYLAALQYMDLVPQHTVPGSLLSSCYQQDKQAIALSVKLKPPIFKI
jgi:hypothetical protein